MPADPTNDIAPSGPAAGVEAVADDPTTTLRWSRRADTTEVELITDDGDDTDADRVTAAVRAIGAIGRRSEVAGSRLHLAVDHPPGADRPFAVEVATALGFAARRELLQMRRALPVAADHRARRPAPTPRPFRPGIDDAAWLRVNNRAFAHHPDQGAETPATLASRSSESWFDERGFLVLDDPDRPDELAGFCWTKVHPATADDPAIGEIYVIGVDPSHHGEGLGVALVLAGLDHLTAEGTPIANLYVEADNRAAIRLYRRLDFDTYERRVVYAP